MRVAVIGGNGQLGSEVCRRFREDGHETHSLTHCEIEISSAPSVYAVLGALDPEVIVNTAAMHHVDNCEANPQHAFAINAIGARNLAQFAASSGACLAHISTDYVFDGLKKSPYIESDLPLPRNVYGSSKLAGEHFVRAIAPRHFVVRVSAIYGVSLCRGKGGLSFVERMLRLASGGTPIKVVGDEFVSPTPAEQIAEQLLVLAQTRRYGLFHATSEGCCSWYEFARAIFEIAGIAADLTLAGSGDFPSKGERPKYSVLENAELKRAGLNVFADWKKGLEHYLAPRATGSIAVAV
jgi:dTDP-4-dehydrorhamnose reductase